MSDNRVIAERGDRWWRLRKPGKSEGEAVIFVSPRGEILVNGDIDLMAFAWGPKDPRAAVAWIANAKGRHLAEKASIGTTCREMVWELDRDALKAELLDRAEHADREGEGDELRRAVEDLDAGRDPHKVKEELYDDGWLDCEDGTLGEVVTYRLEQAHTAVRRLHELLNAESMDNRAEEIKG